MSNTAFNFYKDKSTSNTNERVRSLVSTAKNKNSATMNRNATDSSDRIMGTGTRSHSPLPSRSQSPSRQSPIQIPKTTPIVPRSNNVSKVNLDEILWKEFF